MTKLTDRCKNITWHKTSFSGGKRCAEIMTLEDQQIRKHEIEQLGAVMLTGHEVNS